ncbi:MAG: hypothetical protein M1824_001473 [Vezdaea acicularis]|nr:MAG: hypothetical protein M1824_001473 [Vezdaea acicularis]
MTDNTSTLGSYVDSASGLAQSALGSVTGNNVDKTRGDARQDKANAEYDASHATAKVGPFTGSTAGAITKDDPNRSEGSWDQTIGSGKETIGNLIGNENLKQQGREQNLQGQGKEAKGQLNDLGGGVADRVSGTLGSIGSSITGDRESQAAYQAQHDTGKTRQRGAEVDLQKQADA